MRKNLLQNKFYLSLATAAALTAIDLQFVYTYTKATKKKFKYNNTHHTQTRTIKRESDDNHCFIFRIQLMSQIDTLKKKCKNERN